ncbi:hypothetical protein CR513_06709, partial [Mucuna pruriens]
MNTRKIHIAFSTMDADIRGPSPGAAGFSQENRSPSRVASGADSSSSDGLQSSSSSGEIFPFEIWYRDNSEDDISEDPFSWVDKEVKKAFSQYTQGSLLLGMMKKFLHPGPWRVRLRHCQPDESKAPKVGWMSLSSRPNRKLLKPFLESFKIFKDKFFKICLGKSGLSLMVDSLRAPLFPFY